MSEKLTVTKQALEKAQSDMGYLQVILDKYNEVWSAEPQKLMENFSENQITLLFYGVLHNQVQNGGFLQLIFNGYAPYVFSEPLIDGLKSWGAIGTSELLLSIKDISLQVNSEMDKSSLDDLSKIYEQYPMYERYDKEFYENDGSKEAKEYVSNHISDFA